MPCGARMKVGLTRCESNSPLWPLSARRVAVPIIPATESLRLLVGLDHDRLHVFLFARFELRRAEFFELRVPRVQLFIDADAASSTITWNPSTHSRGIESRG